MKGFNYIWMLSLAVLLGCNSGGDNPGLEYAPQMYHSVPYEPLTQITDQSAGEWLSNRADGKGEFYNSNGNNPFSMNSRIPPANTVARNKHGYLPVRISKDSLAQAARELVNPHAATPEIIAEGKGLYETYCIHCHGTKGLGDGSVGQVYKGVTAYTASTVKDQPNGHIFHVITYGKGRMGAHASQVSVDDRWKLARYVETLQKQ